MITLRPDQLAIIENLMPDRRKIALENPDILRELFRYDPVTGELFWRRRDAKWFMGPRSATMAANWNSRFADKPALITEDRHGYLYGTLFLSHAYRHRVAFAIHHGFLPPEIDHEDRDVKNNRIANLRPATHGENMENLPLFSTNSSGVNGVSFNKRRGLWRAYLNRNDRQIHIGYYDQIEDAAAAREIANRDNGFHPTHGLPNV